MRARTLFAAAGLAALIGTPAAVSSAVGQQGPSPRVIVYKAPT